MTDTTKPGAKTMPDFAPELAKDILATVLDSLDVLDPEERQRIMSPTNKRDDLILFRALRLAYLRGMNDHAQEQMIRRANRPGA